MNTEKTNNFGTCVEWLEAVAKQGYGDSKILDVKLGLYGEKSKILDIWDKKKAHKYYVHEISCQIDPEHQNSTNFSNWDIEGLVEGIYKELKEGLKNDEKLEGDFSLCLGSTGHCFRTLRELGYSLDTFFYPSENLDSQRTLRSRMFTPLAKDIKHGEPEITRYTMPQKSETLGHEKS